MSNFQNEFDEMLKELDKLDITTSPKYITAKALTGELIYIGFDKEVATSLVAKIDFDTNHAFVNDKTNFAKMITTFANLLSRAYKQLEEDGLEKLIFSQLNGLEFTAQF